MTTKSRTSPRSWSDRRLNPDHRLGLRLTLASLAAFLVLVPFAGLLALVETKWGPLERLDEDATRTLNEYVLDHRGFVHPLQATSYIFHAWVFRLIIGGLAIWLFVRGARRLAVWAMTTLVVGGLLGLLFKVVVDRPRPDLESPIAHAPGGSFPSGHAMTAALGCLVIVLILLPVIPASWRKAVWAVAAVVAVAAGFCRVALGVHYVSDVLAGWVFGLAVVIATTTAFETWRRSEGRAPATPAIEGVEPEAAPEIAPSGDPSKAPDRT
ncbi:phosphatase PAP2 family protein [Actinomadura sp. HBU206391]|uniref:phosphatase PAP2 family protein n=1 Tax=Actinomadura sp. HBU206391 TaxID=2731692 RepID=UPI002905F793|nr:phosphatase PAP2 family protein [Actinomadura sp. HBU206391]